MLQLKLIPYTSTMLNECGNLYRESVKSNTHENYTAQQINARAAAPDNTEWFRQFLESAETLVAVNSHNNRIYGFCGLKSDGHITSLYVAANRQRMGIGTRLLKAQMQRARDLSITRLFTEASEFSLGTFLREGFTVTEIEHVIYNGAEFDRYKMSRFL